MGQATVAQRVKATADYILVVVVGLIIFLLVVGVPSSRFYGDDATLWTYAISLIAKNFPYPSWDPCCFAGYRPMGLGPSVLLPSAVAARLGMDPALALNITFMGFFLLLGVSIYYFTRVVGGSRIVSFALAVLAWGTNHYYNATVWGASYDRFFAVPFFFLTLAVVYKFTSFLNQNTQSVREVVWSMVSKPYLVALIMWFLLMLSNIYIAAASSLVLLIMVPLSLKRITSSLTAMLILPFPVFMISSWYWGKVLDHVLNVWRGLPTVIHVLPNPVSSLYIPGKVWEQTLTYSYIPLLLVSVFIAVWAVFRRRVVFDRPRKALLVSASLSLAFWFIEGWVPQVWWIFPRIFATYDSILHVGNLSILLMAALSSSFVQLKGTEYGLKLQKDEDTVDLSIRIPKPRKSPSYWIGVGFLLVTVTNAAVFLPYVTLVEWTSFYQAVDKGMNSVLDFSSYPSSQFRIALSHRGLTRWFPMYHPDIPITGGRFFPIDVRPQYTAWFEHNVFYRGDQKQLAELYYEDSPGVVQPYFFDDINNVATTLFWLDWLGAKDVAMVPGVGSPNSGTIAIYEKSPFLQEKVNTRTFIPWTADPALRKIWGDPSYPVYVYSTSSPTPMAVQTDSKITGVFVSGSTGEKEYNLFLASLSYLDLGPSYIVPLKLDSRTLLSVPLDALVTDESTYSTERTTIESLANSGVRVLLLPDSPEAARDNAPYPSNIVSFRTTLEDAVRSGPSGSYEIVNALFPNIVKVDSRATRSATIHGLKMEIAPTQWQITSSVNDVSSIENVADGVKLNVQVNETGKHAQTDITFRFPQEIDLLKFKMSLEVESDVNLPMSVVLTQIGVNNDILIYDAHPQSKNTTKLDLTISDFKWKYSWRDIGKADKLVVVFNIPLNATKTSFWIKNAMIEVDDAVIYRFPRPIETDAPRFIRFPTGELSGELNLAVGTVNGSYSQIKYTLNNSTTTITPLTSASGRISSFNEIHSAKDLGETIDLISYVRQEYVPLDLKWLGSATANITGVEAGFKGIVWKESFTTRWKYTFMNGTGATGLQGIYAGPGLVYIPTTPTGSGSIIIGYEVIDYLILGSLVSTLIVATLIISLRILKRFPREV